jgi:hypothetical protein
VASFFFPVVYLQYNPQQPIGGMNIPYIEGGVFLFPAIFVHLTLALTLMFYVGHCSPKCRYYLVKSGVMFVETDPNVPYDGSRYLRIAKNLSIVTIALGSSAFFRTHAQFYVGVGVYITHWGIGLYLWFLSLLLVGGAIFYRYFKSNVVRLEDNR